MLSLGCGSPYEKSKIYRFLRAMNLEKMASYKIHQNEKKLAPVEQDYNHWLYKGCKMIPLLKLGV